MFIYKWIRHFLFQMEPEKAHAFVLNNLNKLYDHKLLVRHEYNLPKQLMNITFPNPVGIAAGLDKNGEYINALSALGFGFIEVGTVTPRPQDGNPKPRMFRLPQAQALINRLGFNNKGVDYLIKQIKNAEYGGVLGINIGKNFDTPLEKAVDDYLFCLQKVYQYADYITVNISSPNTPGLRQLQFGEELNNLLASLKKRQTELTDEKKKYVPVVIKISPDLTQEQLENIAQTLISNQIDGVIATNTTVSREAIENNPLSQEQGGLSGKPLFNKSTEIVQQLHQLLQNKIPIIGVGGIMSAHDAQLKFQAGADLIQIYTGFIYKGPGLIGEIVHSIAPTD